MVILFLLLATIISIPPVSAQENDYSMFNGFRCMIFTAPTCPHHRPPQNLTYRDLSDAVKDNDIAKVKRALNRDVTDGDSIDTVDLTNSLIHARSLAMARLLQSNGAQPQRRILPQMQQNLLHIVMTSNMYEPDLVRMYRAAGVSFSHVDYEGNTPLDLLLLYSNHDENDVKKCQYLLESLTPEETVTLCVRKVGSTPQTIFQYLQMPRARNNTAGLRDLLEQKFIEAQRTLNPTEKPLGADYLTYSPAHFFQYCGPLAHARATLLQMGSIYPKEPTGRTLPHQVVENPTPLDWEHVVRPNPYLNALAHASQAEKDAACARILSLGFTNYGLPLRRCLCAAFALMGANLSVRGDGDSHPLVPTVDWDDLPLAELLCAYIPDTSKIRTYFGEVIFAAKSRAMIQLLLAHGSTLTCTYSDGHTPLMESTRHHYPPEVIDFYSTRIPRKTRNRSGNTALHNLVYMVADHHTEDVVAKCKSLLQNLTPRELLEFCNIENNPPHPLTALGLLISLREWRQERYGTRNENEEALYHYLSTRIQEAEKAVASGDGDRFETKS